MYKRQACTLAGGRHIHIDDIVTMAGWDIDKDKWPQDMGLKAFWEFFDIEIHDMVLDMEEADLNITPVFDNMM